MLNQTIFVILFYLNSRGRRYKGKRLRGGKREWIDVKLSYLKLLVSQYESSLAFKISKKRKELSTVNMQQEK